MLQEIFWPMVLVALELWPAIRSGLLCLLDGCSLFLGALLIKFHLEGLGWKEHQSDSEWDTAQTRKALSTRVFMLKACFFGLIVGLTHVGFALFPTATSLIGDPSIKYWATIAIVVVALDGAFYMISHALHHLLNVSAKFKGLFFWKVIRWLKALGPKNSGDSEKEAMTWGALIVLTIGSSGDGIFHGAAMISELDKPGIPSIYIPIGLALFGLAAGFGAVAMTYGLVKTSDFASKPKTCCGGHHHHHHPKWRDLFAVSLLSGLVIHLAVDLIGSVQGIEAHLENWVIPTVILVAFLYLGIRSGLMNQKRFKEFENKVSRTVFRRRGLIGMIASAFVVILVTSSFGWLQIPNLSLGSLESFVLEESTEAETLPVRVTTTSAIPLSIPQPTSSEAVREEAEPDCRSQGLQIESQLAALDMPCVSIRTISD